MVLLCSRNPPLVTFVCFVVVGFFEGFPKPSIFLANINKQIVKSQIC